MRHRNRRIALLVAALLTAVAASFAPTLVSNADDFTAQAVSHKSPFNCNKTFYANNWSGGHNPSNSIDWQTYGSDAINGETVRATAAGTAYFYNEGSTSYGRWVKVVHSDGTQTRYAHLATQVKSPGSSMSVSQGTIIGTVGSTGGSTAPTSTTSSATPAAASSAPSSRASRSPWAPRRPSPPPTAAPAAATRTPRARSAAPATPRSTSTPSARSAPSS
nr:hypothetical protein GCM10025732_19830 [Glycomyces mayteni]